jgi:hypothetical protein
MLRKMVEGFDMGKFVELLPSRVEQIDEEIYEILCSVSEF